MKYFNLITYPLKYENMKRDEKSTGRTKVVLNCSKLGFLCKYMYILLFVYFSFSLGLSHISIMIVRGLPIY